MAVKEVFVERKEALMRNVESAANIFTLQGTLLNELLDISRMMAERELAGE